MMRGKIRIIMALTLAAAATALISRPQVVVAAAKKTPMIGRYPLTWASLPHKGVPQGTVFTFDFRSTKIFPGTRRLINVYIPAEYTGKKPACVMVALDGWAGFQSRVFDNLIYKKQLPITIGVGLVPGVTIPAGKYTRAQRHVMMHMGNVQVHGQYVDPRWNRSFEFDGVSDRLAHFLIQEVLPAVEKHRTPSGLPILLTNNPNDRGITGFSSGGIGAFNVGWLDPNAFRRVNTAIGTFVDMRGGQWYPSIVRKMEPKPLRIFMQSGSHDNWPGGPEMGSWPLNNLALNHALKFAGYAVAHAWGPGVHSGNQGIAVFPQAMRWIWKDWKKPIQPGKTQNAVIQAVTIAGQGWHPLAHGSFTPGALAVNSKGQVFFDNTTNGKIYRLEIHGGTQFYAQATKGNNGMAFGPGGRLYVTEPAVNEVVAFAADAARTVIARHIHAWHLVVTHGRDIYLAGATGRCHNHGAIWLIRPGDHATVVATNKRPFSGILLQSDDHWLCAPVADSHWGESYQVRADGALQYPESYYWFEHPPWTVGSGTHGLCVDNNGWIYAATYLGVQVLDRSGRVTAILLAPKDRPVRSVCFGGRNFHHLFIISKNHIFERQLKSQGIANWHVPTMVPPGAPW